MASGGAEIEGASCIEATEKKVTTLAKGFKKLPWNNGADVIVVDTPAKLKYTIANIKKRDQVSVAFFGSFGESPECVTEQVVFCFRKNVMIIEIEKVKNIVWQLLKTEIFENGKLLKIGHDLRPIALYLFNYQMIHMENVFDTQLIDLYIRFKDNPDSFDEPKFRGFKTKWALRPLLPYMLDRYLYIYWGQFPAAELMEFLKLKKVERRMKNQLHAVLSVIFLENLKSALEVVMYKSYNTVMHEKIRKIVKMEDKSQKELYKILTRHKVSTSVIEKAYLAKGLIKGEE